MMGRVIHIAKQPRFNRSWINFYNDLNFYYSWNAMFPLTSPSSFGKDILAGNSTFPKKITPLIEGICIIRRIYWLHFII